MQITRKRCLALLLYLLTLFSCAPMYASATSTEESAEVQAELPDDDLVIPEEAADTEVMVSAADEVEVPEPAGANEAPEAEPLPDAEPPAEPEAEEPELSEEEYIEIMEAEAVERGLALLAASSSKPTFSTVLTSSQMTNANCYLTYVGGSGKKAVPIHRVTLDGTTYWGYCADSRDDWSSDGYNNYTEKTLPSSNFYQIQKIAMQLGFGNNDTSRLKAMFGYDLNNYEAYQATQAVIWGAQVWEEQWHYINPTPGSVKQAVSDYWQVTNASGKSKNAYNFALALADAVQSVYTDGIGCDISVEEASSTTTAVRFKITVKPKNYYGGYSATISGAPSGATLSSTDSNVTLASSTTFSSTASSGTDSLYLTIPKTSSDKTYTVKVTVTPTIQVYKTNSAVGYLEPASSSYQPILYSGGTLSAAPVSASQKVTVTDLPKGKITITKLDSKTKKPVPDVTFELYKYDGSKYVATGTTAVSNSKGVAEFTGLTYDDTCLGRYRVFEKASDTHDIWTNHYVCWVSVASGLWYSYTITYYPVSQSNPKDPNLKVTAKGNGVNSGTGYLELSWDKVEGAQNYYVGIHNGKEYEYFYVTGTTSWTTKGKGIWPTETEINNGRYSLHHDGKGAELPMIPAFTYNNSGGTLAGSLNYSVCVIPANEYGQAPNPKYFGAKTAVLPDTLPPSQASTVSVSPADYTNANTITVSWSGIKDYNNKDTSAVASLGTGHVQYSINSTADWKNTSSSNGTGSAKIDVSSVRDGRNVIYLRATDSAGNTSTPQSLYFYIDRTPPTVPVISVVPEDWSDADSVSLTWSGISDMNDLLRVEYAIDGGAYQSTGKTDPAYSGYAIDTSALTDGEHTIRVRAVDILGNTGETATVTIYKDTTAPSVTETAVDPDSWTNADEVTLGWTGLSDTHSGMALVWYSVDGGDAVDLATEEEYDVGLDISTLSGGEHTILLHFEDQVGNSREETLTVYRDATDPDVAILSPADGSAVNGTVEVLGSVHDLSLDSWTLTAVGEDGSERILASGEEDVDGERLGVLNCSLYEDGERVQLKLYAVDKAGNESKVTGTAIVVDKSAAPISGAVTITAPDQNEKITAPSTDGGYTVDYAQPETEGLLYIDGVYQGSTGDETFAFDAITYDENSVHSISVLSRAEDGSVQFSEGLSSYVLHADAFEDDGLLSSHSSVTVDHGASLNGGSSGTVISKIIKPALPILALRLNVTEDKPAGTDIRYSYSLDNGSTWTAIAPDTDVPLLVRPNTIRLKAELTGSGTVSPALYGWTLQGVIETNPTRVVVSLTRPVENIDVSAATVSSALTELTAQPKNNVLLRQYRDGDYVSGSFTYDARDVKDNEAHQVVLVAETANGSLHGTGAEVEVLLRGNVTSSGTVISDALMGDGKLYALRLEALYSGKTSFSYSTDGSTWHTITPGQYAYLEQGSEQVYVRAQGGTLTAWHVEGITCKGTNVTAQIMKAPTNVVAADWGADYYANEKLRYYVLSWTDHMPKDGTASYTTAYEVYRNGKLIATTTDTRYTDHDYITGARYEVRTVRTYKGFAGRNSAKTAATRTSMKAPERVIGVNCTAEEQKQSEYLNKLYGGNYTFSNTAKAPVDDRALDMSLLGRNKMCAYGWEPINFNTGNFLLETVDGTWADLGLAELTVDRTYNAQSDAPDGPFGAHWSGTWAEHLRLYTEGDVVYVAADGAEIIFTMDANGVYTGGESRGLTLTTGGDGREYWITDLDGVTHAFTGMGLLSGIQWSDGNRITVRRDEDGLITGLLLPSGETLNVESDKSGHITAIATLGGSTLQYEYEGNDLVAFTDADGSVTRYVYDSQSRMTEWYDAKEIRQVKNTYDSKNRVVAQIDANGGAYSLEYFDDHTVITDADNQVSEIWYDELKRTTRTVDASGGEMGYEYDQFGNIVAMTNENGNTTRYEYDDAGNKVCEIAPDGSSYSLIYDENNNLTQLTDQLGNVTRYEYDENNRLTRQTNPDGGETTYTYNAAGQVLTVTDPLGNTTAYAYDGANLISSTDPNGNTTAYAYDSENRLVSTTDALGNTTTFAYDGADNLVSVTFADGTSFAYEYDRVGNLTSQTDALGSVTTFEYDALRQLVKTTYPDGSETTNRYDVSGNLVSTTDAGGSTATAEYDAVGRLLAVTDALGNTTAYEYDRTGQLTAETLANGGKTHYNYDNMGRVTRIVTATGEQTSYTYDAADNILTVTAPDGGVTAYTYDSMGRLLTETAPDGATTQYAYDLAGNLSTVTDALGNTTAYTYDPNGNLFTVTDALGGVTRYEYDALNRVVSMTDANGAVTGYTYDAVGNLVFPADDPAFEDYIQLAPDETDEEREDSFYPEPETNRFAHGAASPVFLRRDTHIRSATAISAKTGENGKGSLPKKGGAGTGKTGEKSKGSLPKKGSAAQKNPIKSIKQKAAAVFRKVPKTKSKGGTLANYCAAKARTGTAKKPSAPPEKPSAALTALNASHPLSATSPSVKPIAGTKKSCSALMTPSGGTTLWEAIKYVFPTMTTAGSIIALADSPVPGPADVLGLIVAGGGTLVVGLGVYAYVNLINPYVTLEPQTPTIISDPVPDITLPQIEIIPELVPDIGSIILPFPFAQEDVSSNITSIPSLEEEGVQIITADGSGSSSSLKKIRSNARANEIARQLGYDGAEDLKEAFVGRSSISKFNMMYDTKTGEIVLVSIEDSSIQVQTGLFIE